MEVKVVEETNDYMRFDLKGADIGFANLLRRFIMGKVKTFAIDKITVYENTTHYFDEFIAHRLGLVPLKTPEKTKGTETVVFTLDVVGPKKVYSRDLKFNDPTVGPVYDNMPLFDLGENASLRLEGVALLGDGSQHAKFQSAFAFYSIDKDETIHFYVETYHQMPLRSIIKNAVKEAKNIYSEIDNKIDEIFEQGQEKSKKEK